MSEFLFGCAVGFGAAWLLWEDRWFIYSLRMGVNVEDIWK